MSSVDREQPREDIGELLLVRPVMHHPEHIELLCEAPRQGWQECGDEAAHVIGAAGHASMLVVVGHDVVVTGPDWRRAVLFRETDLEVRRRVGKTPLSVAADKIA